jgi:hypothetical protein
MQNVHCFLFYVRPDVLCIADVKWYRRTQHHVMQTTNQTKAKILLWYRFSYSKVWIYLHRPQQNVLF